jgi:cell division protein FtsQ
MYRRVAVGLLLALAAGVVLYQAVNYFLYSPSVRLHGTEQIEVTGNRYVPAVAIVEKFSEDIGRSVMRVPLTERRKSVESLAWVEQAAVQRVLPNRILVSVTERSPVAYLRSGNELALVDSHGVILDRPNEGEFHFPVVSGLTEAMSGDARAQRMGIFVQFIKDIEAAHPGADDHVSEVDLSDAADVRATLTGLGSDASKGSPILVHFGDSDFANRYHLLAENVDQWRAGAGGVDSVDLRFARQVVVNPESRPVPVARAKSASAPVKKPVAARKRH